MEGYKGGVKFDYDGEAKDEARYDEEAKDEECDDNEAEESKLTLNINVKACGVRQ